MRIRFGITFLLSFVLIVVWSAMPLAAQTIYWKADHIRDSNGNEIAVATPVPSDTTAPDPPTALNTTTVTTTSVAISWTPPAVHTDVIGYVIYRGPIPVASVAGTVFTDVGLSPYTDYHYRVVAFDAAHNYSGYSAVLDRTTTAVSTTPLDLTAEAVSTSQVDLAWAVPSGGAPHHYGIWRRSSGGWTRIDTSSSTSYSDTTVSASTAYLYKVSAENSSDVVQGYTNIDLATTVMFTDSTLTVGTTVIKAVHVTELRTAINAVRTLAGLGAASWTNSSLSSAWIHAVDVSELRTALGDAIVLLNLTAPSYTDSVLTAGSTSIKKAHIEEIRQRVK